MLALGLWLSLALAGPAHATWFRAETDRFVVYGEGREQRVRDYATKLMVFDRMLRAFHPSTADRVPGTKLVVYLVNSQGDLRRVRPGLMREIGGFYAATNEGIFAIGLDATVGVGTDDIMFHEYAHHFMLENFPVAYPAWFVEGFAEYFAPTEIKSDRVEIGGFSEQRAYGIFAQQWLPLEEVLSRTTGETRRERLNAYYSEAWLLMHYMRSDSTRAQQLDVATRAIGAGQPPVKAFEAATGMTMEELTRALKGYRRLQRLGMKHPFPIPPPMTVTRLGPSADDLLLEQLRLLLSASGQTDAPFLESVRRKAARYPGDTLAELTLARAEFTMGDPEAGRAVLKRRIEANAQDVEALVLAGAGEIMAGDRKPETRAERYRAARGYFAKAYAIRKDDFRPLYLYAASRAVESAYPNDNDLKALLEARALAPSVQEISLRTGLALLKRGDHKRAEIVLAPLINNPHGGRGAAQAKALLQGAKLVDSDIEKGSDGGEGASPTQPAPPAKPVT